MLTALPYHGGKAGYGKAAWINTLLPAPRKGQVYCEPYGGMCGVLLNRAFYRGVMSQRMSPRTEVLWTNKPPPSRLF